MKNLVIVSFPAKEESLDILKNAMKDALPETRAFDGCISVDTYIEESTNTIHLIEDWESLDHQAKYLNWRVETGLLTALDPILDGGAASIKVILCGKKESNI
jgi:quinol monooxygenase YgiN